MSYEPLGPNEIRLFKLHPGPDSSVIKLEFLPHVSLDALPPYHALSYAWGDSKITKPITILTTSSSTSTSKLTTINATTNLVSFLHSHRKNLSTNNKDKDKDENKHGILWVDAICINQLDKKEKNRQLLLMRQVYEKASSTIVWLGVETKACEKGLLLIEKAPRTPISGRLPKAGYEYTDMLVDMNPWLEEEENVALVKVRPQVI
jgi:Heterokaryon incompatibility protein (HET)